MSVTHHYRRSLRNFCNEQSTRRTGVNVAAILSIPLKTTLPEKAGREKNVQGKMAKAQCSIFNRTMNYSVAPPKKQGSSNVCLNLVIRTLNLFNRLFRLFRFFLRGGLGLLEQRTTAVAHAALELGNVGRGSSFFRLCFGLGFGIFGPFNAFTR